MKLYISADIEGVTGVVSWKQCGSPSSEHYDWAFARRMMTHDVNAAIRGARFAGATEIVVKDSHNVGRNLLIDELEPGVELISGTRACKDGMVEGIDGSFDAMFLVGYHGMAGTAEGVMEHTISGRIHRCWVNGREVGEQGFSAYTAGQYGVPLTLVTSDDKGCQEAADFVSGVQTAVVKFGMGRYFARLLHPSVTGPMIMEAASAAVRSVGTVDPLVAESPVVRVEFNRSEEVDESCLLQGWERLDAYTLEQGFSDWAEAHVGVRRLMAHAGLVG